MGSVIGVARAVTIVGAKLIPAAIVVNQGTTLRQGFINAGANQIGMRPDGSFSWDIVGEQWLPVVVVTGVDFALSKAKAYRHVGRVLSNLG